MPIGKKPVSTVIADTSCAMHDLSAYDESYCLTKLVSFVLSLYSRLSIASGDKG